MFTGLTLLNDAYAMARHAAARQVTIAQNVANVDTPGYKSRDLPSFKDAMAQPDARMTLAASRPGHLGTTRQPVAMESFVDGTAETSPDGNSVSVEAEMLKSIEAERQHARATAIYQSTMNILRASIGRGR